MAKQITYLTTAQAAAELGVSVRRVQALVKAGRLSARRLGRDYLIDPAALAAVRHRPQGWPKGRPRGPRKIPKNSANGA